MISVSNLAVRAGDFQISGISFEVPTGAWAALMGQTGTGKTTIMESICGLRSLTAGTIHIHDRNVTGAHPADREIGYVPQEGALFLTMSVFDNLAFALQVRKWTRPRVRERVDELAEFLKIEHLLDRNPRGLSGGEKQRVALGRALAFRPAVLCLDEPLSALDDATRAAMYELLGDIRQQTGVTTLHITHSEREADALASTILRLKNGEVETVTRKQSPSPTPTPGSLADRSLP